MVIAAPTRILFSLTNYVSSFNQVKNKLFFSICLAPLIGWLLGACAAHPSGIRDFDRGKEALAAGNIEAAYRFFEDAQGADRVEVKRLLQTRPDVLSAGAETFSQPSLLDSIALYGRPASYKLERKRLALFSEFGSSNQTQFATATFQSIFGREIADDLAELAERARVDKLPEAEQAAYWAERHKKWLESVSTYGKILSGQLINESTSGNISGSILGSVLGQAAYIDTRNIFNYSALGQLQAGIAGAALGLLFNRSPTTSFRKVYFIKTSSGTKRIDQIDSSQILLPVGTCILYREPFTFILTEDEKCSGLL
jgi:hypothetical protein